MCKTVLQVVECARRMCKTNVRLECVATDQGMRKHSLHHTIYQHAHLIHQPAHLIHQPAHLIHQDARHAHDIYQPAHLILQQPNDASDASSACATAA